MKNGPKYRYLWLPVVLLLATVTGSPRTGLLPFETLDEGDISYVRYGDAGFRGGEFLITNQPAWESFWTEHKQGIFPTPPLPEVKFPQENVLVVILGYQTTGGGPSIRITSIEDPGGGTRTMHREPTVIQVEENTTGGPFAVITNPYHIVKVPRMRAPISWVHEAP